MHKMLHGAVLVLGLALAGCASNTVPPANIKTPESAMLYGYVELDNRAVVEEVEIQEYGKFYLSPFIRPPRVLVYNDGTFVAENIKPGKYVISRIRSLETRFDLAPDKRRYYQRILHVEPGSLTYAGAFHIRKVPGSSGRTRIEVSELQRPGERDILKELYRITEDTAWQYKVADRMRQLRQ